MSTPVDVVTVYHNEKNFLECVRLSRQLALHETGRYRFIAVDNRTINRGFARACNIGASLGQSSIVAFLNPDLIVLGPFLDEVFRVFEESSDVKITGENFKKPKHHFTSWGCRDWVCGAAFFVRRPWWEQLRGFDERFVWGWEETDLIRRTERANQVCKSIELNLHHDSPGVDVATDLTYKRHHFYEGARYFRKKWGLR